MKIPIKDALASSLGVREETPNIMLAEDIVKRKDHAAVKDLFHLVHTGKNAHASDAIKVLYEIARRDVRMIIGHHALLIELLSNNNNRLQWGAMTALSEIAKSQPRLCKTDVTTILDSMDHGSVITRDHGMFILCRLAEDPSMYKDVIVLLFEQLEKAPVNQMPMYAEYIADIIMPEDRTVLIRLISSRSDVMEIPSKEKRLNKLIRLLTV